jgi:shikimate dehydrogenase
MKAEIRPLLAAAQAHGCPVRIGTDMLFEMTPAYLGFGGLRNRDAG